MKSNRYAITLLGIGAVSIVLLISDISSYARGSRSFLLGSKLLHQETQSSLSDRLSKIGSDIAILSARLSQLEQSISKSNEDVEKIDSPKERRHYNRRHEKLSGRKDGKSSAPTEDTYTGIDNRHMGIPIDDLLDMQVRDDTQGSSHSIHKALLDPHNPETQKSYDENDLTSGLGMEPDISHLEIRKVQVSVGPSGKSHKLLPGFRIHMDDIFPDLSKEDPIVELKRFDDADSFRAFGNNMRAHKTQENDKSHIAFYRMSDIIGPSKFESPLGKDAAGIKGIQRLPHILEAPSQKQYTKTGDSAPKDVSKDAKIPDFGMLDVDAGGATSKTNEGKTEGLYDMVENAGTSSQREELLKSTKHSDVISGTKDVLSQIKSSISDLEAQIKESKKIEEKIAEKAMSLGKKVDFSVIPEDTAKETKDLELQAKYPRQDLIEDGKGFLKSIALEEDGADKIIGKSVEHPAT